MASEQLTNELINDSLTSQEEHIKYTHVYIWDLPLRIFHWLLVIAVTVAIVTAKLGGNWMNLHGKAGLTIIGLLVFRVIWGFIGPHHSRFLVFFPKPQSVIQYLKGHWKGTGHNPIGALATLLLLSVLSIQGISGLFSNNEIDFTGPLSILINESFSKELTLLHHLSANLLYGLLAMHIFAILFYLFLKKNNLIKPMITGWQKANGTQAIKKNNDGANFWKFLITLIVALIIVYYASGKNLDSTPTAPTVTTPSW